MILVTGATGKVGRHVVTGLLAQGHRVRALSRTPRAAALPAGVEVVAGSPADAESCAAALAGAHAAFVVLAGDVATQAREFAAAVKAAGGGCRVVLLSSASVLHPLRHRIGDEHRQAEELLSGAAGEWAFLRPGPFHSNALWWASSIRDSGRARCLVGNQPGASIDPADVAAIGILALTGAGQPGATYQLTGAQVLTSAEQVQIIAEVIGRHIEFEVVTTKEAVATFTALGGDPDAAAANVAALRSPQVPWARPVRSAAELLGRPPRSFRSWVAEHAARFVGCRDER